MKLLVLILAILVSSISFANATDIESLNQRYVMNCDGKTEELNISSSNGVMKIESELVSDEVEVKNQTILIRIGDNDDGGGKIKYFKKTKFSKRGIEIKDYLRSFIFNRLQSSLKIAFNNSDLSAGTLTYKTHWVGVCTLEAVN